MCVCVYARSERDAHVSMVSSIARPLRCLEKEAHDFSSRMLALRFLMRHHPVRRRDHEVPELSRRENVFTQLHDAAHGDVEARGDDPTLVDSADEVHDDLPSSVIIHDFKVTNVPVLLHELEKLDDDLRRWSD